VWCVVPVFIPHGSAVFPFLFGLSFKSPTEIPFVSKIFLKPGAAPPSLTFSQVRGARRIWFDTQTYSRHLHPESIDVVTTVCCL